tara:strand:+ start:35418 stop:35645 length:228 start_codon:yes stop_codon:yes gene_type:complete
MTHYHHTIRTTDLVQYLSLTKESELYRYKNKILQLEQLLNETPNNRLYKHKYIDAKNRFEHLKKKCQALDNLECY